MQKEPVVGLPEEPVAKITHFGWVVMSPGNRKI